MDFARAASTAATGSASVVRLEYDPNRSARIALLQHPKGTQLQGLTVAAGLQC